MTDDEKIQQVLDTLDETFCQYGAGGDTYGLPCLKWVTEGADHVGWVCANCAIRIRLENEGKVPVEQEP